MTTRSMDPLSIFVRHCHPPAIAARHAAQERLCLFDGSPGRSPTVVTGRSFVLCGVFCISSDVIIWVIGVRCSRICRRVNIIIRAIVVPSSSLIVAVGELIPSQSVSASLPPPYVALASSLASSPSSGRQTWLMASPRRCQKP